ncbi:hypothetical protein CONLIGDRAFT_80648 [Coniochaeta ligniaria NRRL 30616]|uniref:Uncharacterized protein n=1 Tax=Coniochaeta ligniaria NRRL 30616 TaxID=1408157 RepID=A0A1J7J7C7_9PEZI|nr:hypothetical protein CONLIGDRAFT_80648 [Coniochaeta ligniaria NRRL 30616]
MHHLKSLYSCGHRGARTALEIQAVNKKVLGPSFWTFSQFPQCANAETRVSHGGESAQVDHCAASSGEDPCALSLLPQPSPSPSTKRGVTVPELRIFGNTVRLGRNDLRASKVKSWDSFSTSRLLDICSRNRVSTSTKGARTEIGGLAQPQPSPQLDADTGSKTRTCPVFFALPPLSPAVPVERRDELSTCSSHPRTHWVHCLC